MATQEQKDALIEAVLAWAGECEGSPRDPSDVPLLKALWTYEGDQIKDCDECDGDCGEPCAPCTVSEAHAGLDLYVVNWLKKRDIASVAHATSPDNLGKNWDGSETATHGPADMLGNRHPRT